MLRARSKLLAERVEVYCCRGEDEQNDLEMEGEIDVGSSCTRVGWMFGCCDGQLIAFGQSEFRRRRIASRS